MADVTTLKHPDIGEVKGSKANEGVEEYLGIQYATVKDRFAPPVLKEYDGKGIEATKIGPQTAPLPKGAEHEQDLIQHRLENTEVPSSDTEGLNLNITVPAGHSSDEKLPVLLFIHGGGFRVGSASFPQYRMARFVALAASKGLPLIAITMNYRLGPPGQLTSAEMREIAGYLPNNALRDQRAAIAWVHRYISGFGGDASEITIAGESAGGISCCFHLQAKEPLFKRIIPMSGTNLLIPPLPAFVADGAYAGAVKAAGVEDKGAEERLEKLRTMDPTELMGIAGAAPLLPVIDDDLPIAGYSYADFASGKALKMPGAKWCEAMMIGDCEFDGNIQGLRLMHRKKGCGKAFSDEIRKDLGNDEHADKLLIAYGITPDLDDDTAFTKILETLNDVGFYAPTLAFAEAFAEEMKTYVYRFNEPNPWDGPWKGRTNHILDISFLFQNFNEFLGEEQRKTADAFAEGVAKFVVGQTPWDAWTKGSKKAKLLGPNGKLDVVEDVPGQETMRKAVMVELAELVEGGMDRLSGVVDKFMRGPPATENIEV